MAVRTAALLGALAIAGACAGLASAHVGRPPASRLLTYLWNYDHWLLRPYVSGVTLSGGHKGTLQGTQRLVGATANVHVTLRDEPKLLEAERHICRVAAAGVQALHLRTAISAVRVWSVEGHVVARC